MNATTNNNEVHASVGTQPSSDLPEIAKAAVTAEPSRKKRSVAEDARAEKGPAELSRMKKQARSTKAGAVLKLVRRPKGASLAELTNATGWQAHSVRGFLSGTVKKKLGLNITSEGGKDGVRRYRLSVPDASAAATADTLSSTPAA
jgi:hypothetical protein